MHTEHLAASALVCVLFGCSASPNRVDSDASGGAAQATGGATSQNGDSGTGGSGTGRKSSGGAATGGSSASGGLSASGGSAAASGTGGTRPLLPTCDGLAGVDQWENITPNVGAADLGVLTVTTDPLDPTTVYITADHAGLHKSTDCGASFTKVNTGRNGDVIDSGMQWVYVIDPVDSQVMYTSPLYGSDLRLFKSTNAGIDWDPVFDKGGNVEQALDYMFTEIFAIDTANHEHLVTNFHVNCKAPHNPVCLAESYDAGATWTIIEGPSEMGGWLEDAGPVVIDDAIYLGVPFGGLFVSADHGKTWNKRTGAGYFHIYQAENDAYYMGGAQTTLQRSTDLVNWTKLDDTPWTISNAIVSDGRRIFAASRYSEIYVAAPVDDGTEFSELSPPPGGGGAKMFAYDAANHVLYSANEGRGLFRMVTY